MLETLRQKMFSSFYRKASAPEELVWHKAEPPDLLKRLVGLREPGRALDVGCGEGVCATYLAKAGWSVVGVDFVGEALALAAERAEDNGVELDLVQSDVLAYEAPAPFDLVLDSGCLHHITGSNRQTYRNKLREWLAPDGDYLLVHFGRRGVLDWRPLGPQRIRKNAIIRMFSDLHLHDYAEIFYDLPFPLGPRAMAGVYWFQPG